jgi:hypothetical protein
VGEAEGDGEVEADADADGEAFGDAAAALITTPLFQTSLFLDLMQVNNLP